jgi:hypothetical protein
MRAARARPQRPPPLFPRRPPVPRLRSPAATKADGLRARPWTGAPPEAAALAALLARTGALPHGPVDEETAIWVGGEGGEGETGVGRTAPAAPASTLSPPGPQFLRDRNLDVDAAVNKLARYLAWRADVRPHELTADDVAAEAATGKAYLHPFPDAAGRPAVVIRCAKHVIGAAPLRKSVELASTVLDAAVASLPPDSETLVGIFDLRGFGPRNADLAFARFLVDACFLYYPRRLGAVLFVDAPWAFKPVWAIVRPLLKKYAALVAFVSADDVVASFKPGEAPADFARSKL